MKHQIYKPINDDLKQKKNVFFVLSMQYFLYKAHFSEYIACEPSIATDMIFNEFNKIKQVLC